MWITPIKPFELAPREIVRAAVAVRGEGPYFGVICHLPSPRSISDGATAGMAEDPDGPNRTHSVLGDNDFEAIPVLLQPLSKIRIGQDLRIIFQVIGFPKKQ
jgi:hypothetical protein